VKHLDLFSGIGGFALAIDRVWGKENVEHIFCENEEFCQEVIKKHWPDSKIFGDIRTVTNSESSRQNGSVEHRTSKFGETGIASADSSSGQSRKPTEQKGREDTRGSGVFILTGGFPCQPFSQAGRRKGTDDDRYLWPEMFRVIREFRPQWVVAENVAGLLTIEHGMVFGQVLTDLENEGYEVQAFVIPAVAVNAPHRRDRVWIVAHAKPAGAGSESRATANERGRASKDRRTGLRQAHGATGAGRTSSADSNATNPRQQYGSKGGDERVGSSQAEWATRKSDTERCGKDASDAAIKRLERGDWGGTPGISYSEYNRGSYLEWNQNWLEVATRLCRVDDGLPRRLDRNPRLKALGNAIVPQVAVEIFKAIKSVELLTIPKR
jgi:DNA (cytosine-5)-methyltransferase 1